ncbi:MAG: SH3 domain-containing protein, partial [Candidatus Zixiibacteriota bacterium]
FRTDYLKKRAVVLTLEASVYSGPSSNTDLEFEGAPGLLVEIVKESGDFYDVLFENKRRGWIKKDLVAII